MTWKDALQFPIYGSLVLGGIYVLYKLIDKDILSLIFTAHFMFISLFYVASMIEIPFSALFGSSLENKQIIKKNININLPLLHKSFEFSLNLSRSCLHRHNNHPDSDLHPHKTLDIEQHLRRGILRDGHKKFNLA